MTESAFKKLVSDWYINLTNSDNVQDGENVNGKHCTDEMLDELEGILSQQSPAVVVPDNSALIPILRGKPEITNRMKSECMGDFSFKIEVPEVNEDCEVTGEMELREVNVPWDLCKAIYKSMATAAIIPAAQSPQRVTEQDANVIINSAVNFMYETDSRHSINYWLHEEGRALLAKLNGDSNEKPN